MTKRTPSPEQRAMIDKTWSRYRGLIIGMQGLFGEVLAAHLTIEAELEDRLRILIPHPDDLLASSGFAQKLTLFVSLLPGPEKMNSPALQQVRRLSKIRNAIAHGDDAGAIASDIHALLMQASEEYRGSAKAPEQTLDALRGVTIGICGFLVGVSEGEAFRLLRRDQVDGFLSP